MKTARFGALAALVMFWAAPAHAQSVSIQFENGLVTIRAQNAPVRAILAEWARQGGARIVNAERVVGAPVTLELTGVPERQALDVVLRGVAGYIAGSREAASAGASSLDRILILPTSAVSPAAAASPRGPAPFGRAPAANVPPAPTVFVPADPEENPPDDIAPGAEPPATPAQLQQRLREAAARAAAERAAAAEAEEADEPQPEATPATKPGNPFGNIRGSSRPGEITPVPEPRQRRNPLRPNGDPEP
jgi:hypothetical protein